jgi:tetratricopeptide (TPR) repeat protein
MRSPLVLLKFVAKAALNAVSGGLAGDVLFEVVPEVAADAWKWWGQERSAEQRREDVQAVAQARGDEARHQVADVVREVAGDRPSTTQQALAIYLSQIPAQVRKTLRRPADPTGTTVPLELVPRQANDLLPLLPPKLPRFKPGDRPLPGVDWQLEELLGVGGFGEVWKARNPHMPSVPPVALKFCLDAGAAAVLRNEATMLDRVMRQGRHPGIVALQHTYLSAETPCLEYEFVGGGDLAGLILEWHRGDGRPEPGQVSAAFQGLVETAGFAHAQSPPIVHRDLKPANVLRLAGPGGAPQFKIADFGIGGLAARRAVQQATQVTARSQFLVSAVRGSYTPLYASPQQMRGEAPDPRDDVYALGVIWYQMLTGNLTDGRPGGTRWHRRLAEQGMKAELVDLLAECFEDDPGDRVADACALAERLGRLLRGPEPPAPPPAVRVPPPPPRPDAPTARELAARGEAHRLRGDFVRALADCAEAIRLDPKNVQAWYNQGETHRMQGELDRAIADCGEALRLDPNYSWAYGTRGAAWSQKGEYDRALADLDRSLRLDPGYAWAYSVRGETHRLRGDFDRAVADCTEAVRLDPRNVKAWYTRGESHRMKDEHDRAIADCTEAIRLDPACAWAYSTRGGAHRMKNDYDAAVADCTEAVRLDPRNPLAWYNRGEARRMKGQYDDAVADCTEAIRLDPNYSWAYGTRGAALRQKGEYDRAIADLNRTVRLDPGYAWAYAVRGEAYRLKGDFHQAVADCTEAVRLDPRSSLAYATRGAAFRQKGDFATAAADLEAALRLNPHYPWAREQLELARRRQR